MDSATRDKVKEALTDAWCTLRHARTFIQSREKMHPTGIELYTEVMADVQAALALLDAPVAEVPAGWEYRWTNPAGNDVTPEETAWQKIVPRADQTLEQRIAELQGYGMYNGKVKYEVRPLFAAPQPPVATEQVEWYVDWTPAGNIRFHIGVQSFEIVYWPDVGDEPETRRDWYVKQLRTALGNLAGSALPTAPEPKP